MRYQDTYLIVQTTKWRGSWGIPGGKVELGETILAAAVREIQEEVGLEIVHVRFALLQEAILSPEFMKPAHFLLFNYFADAVSNEVCTNEEIVQYAWVTLEEALEYPLNSYTKALILLAQEAQREH